jgi:uncharacterized caspase-like protein
MICSDFTGIGKSMKNAVAISILTITIFNSIVVGQTDRKLERQAATNQTVKRIALVIGNGAYTKAKPLPNPSNDAADMAKALQDLGFEVISGVNQNKRQMEALIREFGTKLASSGGVGLFYYAGHGLQVSGENYLVPVDADIPEEDEVSYSAVPISLVLGKMQTAKNDLNIIILDACRNNPFARSWRSFRDSSNNDGLAKISPPTGTLVLYATEPGKVASDGTGRNGLFTEALLKQIKQPNLEYDKMVKALSVDVWQKSNKQQLPWKEGNSLQDFYFAKAQMNVPNTITTNTPVKVESVAEKDKSQVEREAWDLIKNSTDVIDFRSFLKEYPNGANADNAKIKLEQIAWDLVKDSKDKAKIQAYLNEFPLGVNAPLARIKLNQLETKTTTTNKIETNKIALTGLYRYKKIEKKDFVIYWLRFYEDGTVICLTGDENVPEAFNKRWYFRGNYKISDSNFEGYCNTGVGTEVYKGIIENKILKLEVTNGKLKVSRNYEFVNFNSDSK